MADLMRVSNCHFCIFASEQALHNRGHNWVPFSIGQSVLYILNSYKPEIIFKNYLSLIYIVLRKIDSDFFAFLKYEYNYFASDTNVTLRKNKQTNKQTNKSVIN